MWLPSSGRFPDPLDHHGIINAHRSGACDVRIERKPAAESSADIAQYFRVALQRVRIDRRHRAAAAQGIEPDHCVGDVQAGAFPASFGQAFDASDEDVRPQSPDVPAERRNGSVSRDE